MIFFVSDYVYLLTECVIRLKASARGRAHSGHLGRGGGGRGCRLLVPRPPSRAAYLLELVKLNVPCAEGFLRFAPNTAPMCGKLEQVPPPHRRFYYFSESKNPTLEVHGRPTFAATYRLVDRCHGVVLEADNGSFEVGPARALRCSYSVRLPYGRRIVLRLQIGTGALDDTELVVVSTDEARPERCRSMSLTLEDGDSVWNHCSQNGDPLRSVQIVSKRNAIRLNISITAREEEEGMWLKAWWMSEPIEELVGACEWGWAASGEWCVSARRDAKRPWRQAEAECARLGGHLASVVNEKEQSVLDDILTYT
ncbi:hypothetical protein EVAR_43374_1 [Eumeta japonica]|uniref:C-type lectin domain-containing protein n=1 Tax=Eumeta variegata TaxID=151549 RepID=A0A4C1WNX1_EUMVA|nr:hypothetical protein EVAR_43374_1 [Eumeta japonica]